LKSLIQFFVSQEVFDQKYLSKLFANFLKHKNFLEQLSSSNRSILVDILSLFVSHYNSNQSTITIDCSKHFPMLLSIYNPTLSKNNQHTLACMYTYEKQGYSMKSAFIWGETALKLYSTTNILLQTSKLEQVMSLLNDRMMMKSILFYPVTRRLRVSLISRRNSIFLCTQKREYTLESVGVSVRPVEFEDKPNSPRIYWVSTSSILIFMKILTY